MFIIQFQIWTGIALFAVLALQLASGLRWVKLGRRHFAIHRIAGTVMAVLAVPHLINGLRIAGVLRF